MQEAGDRGRYRRIERSEPIAESAWKRAIRLSQAVERKQLRAAGLAQTSPVRPRP